MASGYAGTKDAIAARRLPRPAVYLLSMLAAALLSLGLLSAALLTLDRTGHLPPPALSNRLCADEKLRFFRDHPPGTPDLMILGSSVAWRHFDGAVYASENPGHSAINAGICGLNFRQTDSLSQWLLPQVPTVRSVLMIVAPPDAQNCENEPKAIFHPRDAIDYTFRDAWPGLLYLRYIDPVSLVRNAVSIAAKRANRIQMDPLVFTPTGDGPLNTDLPAEGLIYDAPHDYSAACFAGLHDLAMRLHAQGKTFAVVTTPLSPAWKARLDADGSSRAQFSTGLRRALQGTGAQFWDAEAALAPPETAFTDAIHMRWSAIPGFTQQILAHVRL